MQSTLLVGVLLAACASGRIVPERDSGGALPDAGIESDAASAPDATTRATDAAVGDGGLPSDAGTCSEPLSRCGNECVNLAADPLHCGDCATGCTPVVHGAATCSARVCGITCDSSYVERAGACEPYSTTPYGTWRPIAAAPAPFASAFHTWTGDRVLVVPLLSLQTQGHLFTYDPVGGAWQTVGATGFPSARRNAAFAWTGSELVVWGGWSPDAVGNVDDGAIWNAADDSWRPMMRTAAPTPRAYASAVWAGDRLIVFGGDEVSTTAATGAEYDIATGIWLPLPTTGAPSRRERPLIVWTGHEVIVWAGCDQLDYGPTRCLTDGARYNPVARTWAPMMASPLGARGTFAYAWTGRELVVWGGANFDRSWSYYADGATYNPATDSWTMLPATSAPARQDVAGAWTGVELVPWGGWETTLRDAVGRWDRDADTWRVMSLDGAPGARDMHAMVWTGREIVVAGGMQSGAGYYERDDGGAWTP